MTIKPNLTKPNGREPADATIKLDRHLRRFLRNVQAGQCLALGAWASRVMRNGCMTEADLARCFTLGFEIE